MEDVSQTLFYPLLGRAKAASQWPELFPDPWATQAAHIAAAEKTPADPGAHLSALFSTFELKEKINPQSSDDQVVSVLKEELQSAIDNSFNVLRTRIDPNLLVVSITSHRFPLKCDFVPFARLSGRATRRPPSAPAAATRPRGNTRARGPRQPRRRQTPAAARR